MSNSPFYNIEVSMESPATTLSIPLPVPVKIMSPSFRDMYLDRKAIWSSIEWSNSDVLKS